MHACLASASAPPLLPVLESTQIMTDPAESIRPPLRELFPPHSVEEWRAAAEKLLKGAPFEKRLVTPLDEGFSLQPLYSRSDVAGLDHGSELPGFPGYLRGWTAGGVKARPWRISQELSASTPAAANAVIREGLERGLDEINLPLAPHAGLALRDRADVEAALANVHPRVPVFLQAGSAALPVAALWFASSQARGAAPAELVGCVASDPLGALVTEGTLPYSLERAWDDLTELTRHAVAAAPGVQTILVSGRPYRGAGSSALQELGYVVATLAETVTQLLERGLTVADIAPRTRIELAVGSHFFVEIAKLRAARVLWSKLAAAFGAAPAPPVHLHCRTDSFNKTRLDPHVNMLRTTNEAFAAIVAGCDSLTVGAFDALVAPPSEFSRRTARNTQLVLREECDLQHVVDPAGGSWYVEWLTDQLARRAWALFRDVERSGGMAAAVLRGEPQREVEAMARRRMTELGTRRSLLVGTNVFPNVGEALAPASTPEPAPAPNAAATSEDTAKRGVLAGLATPRTVAELIDLAASGASLPDLAEALWRDETPVSAPRLARRRLAEDFEELRIACVAHEERTGAPPTVLQANLGPSRQYRARADWTSDFFRVGGFRVLSDRDFESHDEVVEAARSARPDLIVVTSTDDAYATSVPALAQSLRQATPAPILVAGTAGDAEAEWRAAGVQAEVNARVDLYATLRALLSQLGVYA